MWDLVSCTGTEPRPPALGAWSLSRWATSEVSPLLLSWQTVTWVSHFQFNETVKWLDSLIREDSKQTGASVRVPYSAALPILPMSGTGKEDLSGKPSWTKPIIFLYSPDPYPTLLHTIPSVSQGASTSLPSSTFSTQSHLYRDLSSRKVSLCKFLHKHDKRWRTWTLE